jgi:signal recognition particle subunit SRP54
MFSFLSEKLSSVFSRLSGQSTLTEQNIDQALQSVQEALLEADVPYEVVDSFLASVKSDVVGQKVLKSLKPSEQFIKVVHEKLIQFLGGQVKTVEPEFSFQLPAVVMVMGLQGSGKTTFIAKLAHYAKEQAWSRGKDRSILVASVDFYRPAAVEQLEILAGKTAVSFFRATSSDPVKAAHEIVEQYKNNRYELLLLDTAGRLHVDTALLQELKAIEKIANPKYKFLVLDGMTGQESLAVAKSFDQAVGFGHAVMTKMDSQTRGGAAFAFRYALKKPIVFVGTGEKVTDLEAFRPERMASRILGMGDILSLIEKAEKNVQKDDQEKLANSMLNGTMTLQDFADQLSMVGKLGSLSSIAKYLPGAPKISDEDMAKGELELKKFKAIIQSMTPKERYYPKVLTASRKERVAKGSGHTVADVNQLLSRFEQSQQFAKLFKQFGRGSFGKGPFG